MKLKHVTFTGVDSFTDIDELCQIQQQYPLAEFGVLVAENWKDNGYRYPDLKTLLPTLADKSLNLSCHLCGRTAREAVLNDFSTVMELCNGYFHVFRRCQLNVSRNKKNPQRLEIDIPNTLNEIIIQQHSANDCGLYLNSLPNDKVSVLLDASGGRGVDTPIQVLAISNKVGYAGGISPDNVVDKIRQLEENPDVQSYWIDMETHVRTGNKFDLDKVRTVLTNIDKYFTNNGSEV